MIRALASRTYQTSSKWGTLELQLVRNLTSLASKPTDKKYGLDGIISILNRYRLSPPLEACVGRSISRLFSALSSQSGSAGSSCPEACPNHQIQRWMHSSSQSNPDWQLSTGPSPILSNTTPSTICIGLLKGMRLIFHYKARTPHVWKPQETGIPPAQCPPTSESPLPLGGGGSNTPQKNESSSFI
jgi:hypothetical protein